MLNLNFSRLSQSAEMQIFVRNLMGGGNFTLDVKPTDHIEIVKAKIQVRTDVFTAVFDNMSHTILGQGRNPILQAETGLWRKESGGWKSSLRVQRPEGEHHQPAATLGRPQAREDPPDPAGEEEEGRTEDRRAEFQKQETDGEADQG